MSTVDRTDPLDLSSLSPREREVLDPATEGLSAREIATRLSLTEATVRSHLSTIYSKLGVAGRVELLARMNGVTTAAGSVSVDEAPSTARIDATSSRTRRWLVASAIVVLVGLLAATALLMTRTDPAPHTDMATVSDLLSSNKIATMVVRDQTLTVTERDGTRLVVDPVPVLGIDPIVGTAAAAGVEVRIEKSASSPSLEAIFATGVVVSIVLLGIVLIVVVWIVRRHPAVRSAG